MNRQDSIEKLYEDWDREFLKRLEKEKGKDWVKENWQMLEKDKESFRSLNLL